MAFIEPMHSNKPNITYLLSTWSGMELWLFFYLLLDFL